MILGIASPLIVCRKTYTNDLIGSIFLSCTTLSLEICFSTAPAFNVMGCLEAGKARCKPVPLDCNVR